MVTTHRGGHRGGRRGERSPRPRRTWWPTPGSTTDLRRSAKLARWALMGLAAYAGVVFTFAPGLVRTGNAALVKAVMPLQVWGVAWLAAAVVLCTSRRAAGHAMLALSFTLYALGTGATAITGTMDAPLGPPLMLVIAALAWWQRARAVARSEGTLRGDDISLPDRGGG